MEGEIKIGARVRVLPNAGIGRCTGIALSKYPGDDWYRILITHHADPSTIHTIVSVPSELIRVLPPNKCKGIHNAPGNHIGNITITLTERERDYLTEYIGRALESESRPLKLIQLLNKISGTDDPGPCGQTKSE